MAKKNLYQQISIAVTAGKLKQPFTVKSVNQSLANLLLQSPSFLSKHSKGNPGGYTELFIRVKRGTYKIR